MKKLDPLPCKSASPKGAVPSSAATLPRAVAGGMPVPVVVALVAIAGAAFVDVGCGHAAPKPTPDVRAAEQARRDRLPDDERILDGTWDDVRVKVAYANGRTQATLELRHPKLRFFYQPPEKASDDSKAVQETKQETKQAAKENAKANAKATEPARAVPEALRKMAPFDIDRIEIHDGELVFVDMSKPEKPEIWLSQLEVSIENVASRVGMSEGRPVLFTASAKVQRSGDLALFVSADPWSDELNFSGRASLEGLATKELYSFLADAGKVQMPKGSLDLYIAFTAKDGHITGGVKPILKNPEVAPVTGGAMARLKAWAADTLLSLNSDRVNGRDAVATVLPIRGDLDGPDLKLWPAIAGVLYNAYVSGVSAGFGGVPAGEGNKTSAAPPRPANEGTTPPSRSTKGTQTSGGTQTGGRLSTDGRAKGAERSLAGDSPTDRRSAERSTGPGGGP